MTPCFAAVYIIALQLCAVRKSGTNASDVFSSASEEDRRRTDTYLKSRRRDDDSSSSSCLCHLRPNDRNSRDRIVVRGTSAELSDEPGSGQHQETWDLLYQKALRLFGKRHSEDTSQCSDSFATVTRHSIESGIGADLIRPAEGPPSSWQGCSHMKEREKVAEKKWCMYNL
uniref:RxLR effector candidate protein n=1 Tax=Hyaloperonospora arabidopsidis (strain Emoy2) TaxID=559515 RepID=M4B7N7_HYAAE